MAEIGLLIMIVVCVVLFAAAIVANSKMAAQLGDMEDAQLRDADTIARLRKASSKYAIESKQFQQEVAELKKDLAEYDDDMEEASATIEEQGVRIRRLLDDLQAKDVCIVRQERLLDGAQKDVEAATAAMNDASKLIESQAAKIADLEKQSETLRRFVESANAMAMRYRQQYLDEKTFAHDVLDANEQLAEAVNKAREALGFKTTGIEPSVN